MTAFQRAQTDARRAWPSGPPAGARAPARLGPVVEGFYARYGKRMLDLVLGSTLAALSLPVLFVLAVGSAVALRGWPFFTQPRVGRGGNTFRCVKLRSLPRNTRTAADKYEVAALPLRRWSRFIRRTHLDELPQLLLVPFGRMSLVGPRPEMPDLVARYPVDFAARRVRVRPGCTGLWQIGADSHRLIFEAPEYDDLYLESTSLRLDLRILLRSVAVMVFGGSRLRLGEVPEWTQKPEPLQTSSAEPSLASEHEVPMHLVKAAP